MNPTSLQMDEDEAYANESKKTDPYLKMFNGLMSAFAYGSKEHRYSAAPTEKSFEFIPLNEAILHTPDGTHLLKLLHEANEAVRLEYQSSGKPIPIDFPSNQFYSETIPGHVIYLIDEAQKHLFICPADESDFFGRRFCFNLDLDKTIATHSFKTKELLSVSTLESDLRFPDFQDIPEIYATNVVSCPMTDFQNATVGVFEVFRDNCISYDDLEQQKIEFLSQWMAEGMQRNKDSVVSGRCNQISDILMAGIHDQLAKSKSKNTDEFLSRLVVLAKKTLDAESAAIFLRNEDDELYKAMTTESLFGMTVAEHKLRLAKELLLAEIATNSNDVMNHPDVYNDPRFDNEVDLKSGKIMRTIIASPIQANGLRNSLGSIQVLNKLKDDCFSRIDENFLRRFAEYAIIWLHLKSMHDKVLNQDIEQRV